MLYELRSAIKAYRDAPHEGRDERARDAAERAAKIAGELLSEPTNVQALALARLLRDRPEHVARVYPYGRFDLPDGYWLVIFDHRERGAHDFECGIAPNGRVSS